MHNMNSLHVHSEQDVSDDSRHELVGRFQKGVTETRWLPFIPGAIGETIPDDSIVVKMPGKDNRDLI